MDQSVPEISPRVGLATLGVVVASVCFGFVPVFARSLTEAGIAPHAVALYRYLLAALVFAPFVWRARRHYQTLLWGLLVGVVMGLGWVGYVRAIEVVPVSTAGVLYMTYPGFTLIISWLLFRDRPTRQGVLGAVMVVAAAAIVSSPSAIAPAQVPALLLSLAAPIGFGFGITILVHRMTRIPALARIGVISMGSILGLLPLVLTTESVALFPATGTGWLMVVGIGLGTALIPQLIYTVCSPVIGTARTAMAGSIELPVMFAVGWLFFGEVLHGSQAVALALVLCAILITPGRRARSIAASRD